MSKEGLYASADRSVMNRYFSGGTMSRRARLAASGAGLAAAFSNSTLFAADGSAAPTDAAPPNIVVFLSDALRADHLGCYGYPFPVSPRIDAFARESLVFEQCYSQAPWTKPSVSSLYTGVLPAVHQSMVTSFEQEGFWHWDETNPQGFQIQILRESFTTLAEALKARGYQTACFQYTPHCQQGFGFARGFDHYRYVPVEPVVPQTDALIKWLQEEAKEPFFVYVHELDPHGPYTPGEALYEKFFGKTLQRAQEELSEADTAIIQKFQMPDLLHLSREGLEHLISLYDAEILGVDEQFGRVLDCLQEKGVEGHTVVSLISDHGEAFGEHGFFKHNNSLYKEELHVPLIIRIGEEKRHQRVRWHVSLSDLYPSLLQLAGAAVPDYVQAAPLFDAQGALTVTESRPVYAYFDHNRPDVSSWEFCMTDGDLKIYDKGDGKPPEIYHQQEDPGEKRNIADALPQTVELQEKIKSARVKHEEFSARFGPPQYAGIDMKPMEELRALGYF